MITRLDHIAVAVPDLDAAIRRFCDDLGLSLGGQEDVASALTKTAFLPLPETRIELIHPLDGQGPVQKFLDTRGGGLPASPRSATASSRTRPRLARTARGSCSSIQSRRAAC